MEDLSIKRTDESPEVNLNYADATLEFSGVSLPEDSNTFYEPVLDWLEAYKKNPPAETILNLKLIYFNTSSSKALLDILVLLESIHLADNNATVLVRWFYEADDEDMADQGADFDDIIEMPFELIEADL